MTATFLYKTFGLVVTIVWCIAASAQLPNYQLNRIQEEGGLKTSDVISMAKDKKGFLWLASPGYVHQFDGRHTLRYPFAEAVQKIVVDRQDRKWIVTRSGVFLFTDSLKGFKQIFFEKGDKGISASLYQAADGSLCALSARKHYVFNDKQQTFLINQSEFAKDLSRATRYLGQYKTSLFFGRGDSIFHYQQQTKQLKAAFFDDIYSIVPLSHHELLVSTSRFRTFYLNVSNSEVRLLGADEQKKDTAGRNLVLSTGIELTTGVHLLCSNKGLYQYNSITRSVSQPVFYYSGRPMENQQSTNALYKDEDGNVFMNHADGIFFLSSSANFIQYFRNYRIGNEQMRSSDVRNFAEDEEGNIWMATANGIAKLNMQTGSLKNLDPLSNKVVIDYPSYRTLLNDGDHLWIGTGGVWLYNKRTGICNRPIFTPTAQLASFDSAYIWKILKLKNGSVLTVAGSGLFITDAGTFALRRLSYRTRGVSRSAIQDSSYRIWHGTTAGLACMDTAFNILFRLHDSLPDKRVASFCEWKKNKMLIGSKGLFEVQIRNNKIVAFTPKKAIPAELLIYCMKQDKLGFVWMGTNDGIFRYDPVKDQAIMFDRSDHVQSQAFNSDAAFLSKAGKLFMGGKNGVNYFDPAAFSFQSEKLQPMLLSFTVNIDDSIYYSPNYQIPYSSRNIDFIISAPEFRKPFRLQYRYRLQNEDDKQWAYTGFNNHVRISRLQPGEYALQVSASYDGITWFDSLSAAPFTVLKPWWQTWWFRALLLLAAIFAGWRVMRYRRKRREAAEMKRAIEYFTYSGSADSSASLILWDITRNCISRLGFEDCVIYLLDDKKNVLVQKAAYGGKSPTAFEISNPIEIPVGNGITGTVAKTGTALIVNDTSKDERYIVDDERRLSEITVPIIHDGKVIGVIDSEHKKKNFFTNHHLKTLQTISSLCSSKIATAVALEAARKAEKELLILNGKMMESKFINLRLQMNPHFLFNILTSIQYLIVSNQVNKATAYLNIFSGFLRSLLSYAEATVVTLEEELRILNMYVELESLCLDETFVWEANVCDEIDKEEVLVPFMLLQPFVENAINHGLIHKIGEKRFSITIKEHDENSLMCIVEDNGIGRTASSAINRKNLSSILHKSKGIGIVEERLALLQQKTLKKACFDIEDLYNNGTATGTRVSIIIPYYSNEEI